VDERTLQDEEGRLRALQRLVFSDEASDPALDAITSLVRDVLGADVCGVSLVDAERQFFHAASGASAGASAPRAITPCDQAIRSREVMIVADAAEDPRLRDSPLVTGAPFIRSYAGAPLTTADGYNLGALCVLGSVPRQYRDDEIALLQRFARLVMDQLELRTMAQRDALTGALTRRAFCDLATSQLLRNRRSGETGALLLIDLDHFKSINDRFGHPAGDQVLRSVGHAVKSALRAGDLFGRLGGEEFAVWLSGVTEDSAAALAERLRATIGGLGLPTCQPVTTSIGWILSLAEGDLDGMLELADRALYDAKRGGRNQVRKAPCPLAEAA